MTGRYPESGTPKKTCTSVRTRTGTPATQRGTAAPRPTTARTKPYAITSRAPLLRRAARFTRWVTSSATGPPVESHNTAFVASWRPHELTLRRVAEPPFIDAKGRGSEHDRCSSAPTIRIGRPPGGGTVAHRHGSWVRATDRRR